MKVFLGQKTVSMGLRVVGVHQLYTSPRGPKENSISVPSSSLYMSLRLCPLTVYLKDLRSLSSP